MQFHSKKSVKRGQIETTIIRTRRSLVSSFDLEDFLESRSASLDFLSRDLERVRVRRLDDSFRSLDLDRLRSRLRERDLY